MLLNDIKSYFETLSQESVDIQSFCYGGVKRILERQVSEFSYPLLFLEVPSYRLAKSDSGDVESRQSIAFVVLQNTDGEDDTDDTLSDTLLGIVADVLARIKHDFEENGLFTDVDWNAVSIDSINSMTLDLDTGWRCEIPLMNPLSLCYNPAKWTN